MRKLVCLLLLVCLLAGCRGEETFETVADEMVFRPAQPSQIRVSLPEDAVLPVMETESGQLYICRDFEVSVQTLPGGDLETTVRTLCGFGPEEVDLVKTTEGGLERCDFVWSSAGETGDQVGRACVVSDGVYHYCVSVMAPEEKAKSYQQIWNGMFETVRID